MKPEELQKLLNNKSKEELVSEILQLHEKFIDVRQYFDFSRTKRKKIHSDIVENYKLQINDALWPDHSFEGGLDIEKVEEVLVTFKQVCDHPGYQIELLLHAVESASQCAYDFGGDFGEDYYEYFEEVFDETLSYMRRGELMKAFKENSQKVIKNAFEGYGHRDTLEELWEKYKIH